MARNIEEVKAYNRGILFGYPDCCIDYYVKELVSYPLMDVWVATGFKPCKKCRSKDPRDVLDKIKERRRFPIPFPFTLNRTKNRDLPEKLSPKMLGYLEEVFRYDVENMAYRTNSEVKVNYIRMRNNQRLGVVLRLMSNYIDLPMSELCQLAEKIKLKYENNGHYSADSLEDYAYKQILLYLDPGEGFSVD